MSTSTSKDNSFPLPIDEKVLANEECNRRERAIKGAEERYLLNAGSDDEGWRSEALAVIDDIKPFVSQMSISNVLPCDTNGIYLNLEIKESNKFTIELSSAGWPIDLDKNDQQQQNKQHSSTYNSSVIKINDDLSISMQKYFETPYSLLDSLSPSYRNSFSNELVQRLAALCK
ncbi:GSK3-beta interaction protein [Sarcoptes scabiei]|uniref:GSK3-beta interaction protein n=1 Tax=Sarcoptes scabiei TaxID=52283 RepID=A0A834VD47_SARSC|nr:GSK3-beta interaction protein [Sarcoptes scabiei]